MENKKSPLLIYREKMEKLHSPEAIKEAFDDSFYAVCFNYDRGYGRAKYALFAAIWEVNPDVIITETDLCIMAVEPIVWRDQLLLIDKNGNKETANTIAKFMAESGIISYEYRIVNESDIKVCFGSVDVKKESPIIRFKGNLLVDGDKFILTARHMNKADREKLKEANTQTI